MPKKTKAHDRHYFQLITNVRRSGKKTTFRVLSTYHSRFAHQAAAKAIKQHPSLGSYRIRKTGTKKISNYKGSAKVKYVKPSAANPFSRILRSGAHKGKVKTSVVKKKYVGCCDL